VGCDFSDAMSGERLMHCARRAAQAVGMASPALHIGRYSVIGAVYAVTTVTLLRRPIFANLVAAQAMASELRGSDASGDSDSIAWVVMPDHVHWLFELRAESLSRVVQRLKSQAARDINIACGTRGAFWQPGFYDRQMRGDEDLLTQARYILGNPVRRGLAGGLGEYPHAWCRYGNDLSLSP
jgi:putative transposase